MTFGGRFGGQRPSNRNLRYPNPPNLGSDFRTFGGQGSFGGQRQPPQFGGFGGQSPQSGGPQHPNPIAH